MAIKNDRWISLTGLNLIRIVIGSYFMAIALGLIEGVDQTALFVSTFDAQTADLIGTILLFGLSVVFMSGLYLRLTALMLALFVLSSSLITSFMQGELVLVSEFWRDLALVCSIMLCYSNLRRRDLRRATLVLRKSRVRRHQPWQGVKPRRVSPAGKTTRRPCPNDYQKVLRPLIAPTVDLPQRTPAPTLPEAEPVDRHLAQATPPDAADRTRATADEDDCDNIFAGI